jgi:hypothetical protein
VHHRASRGITDGLGTSASAAKLRANELVKRHEYAGAAEVYTTALGVLVAINGLCTAVPPPRVQNSGEFNNKIPANVDAWNFYPSVGDPSDHGRTMVFGGCLHTGHPLIKLREQLLANRALCYLKLGWPHSAMSDCMAVLHTDPTHIKALWRYCEAYEALSVLATAHEGAPIPQEVHTAPPERRDAAAGAQSTQVGMGTAHQMLEAAKDAAVLLFKLECRLRGPNRAFEDRAVDLMGKAGASMFPSFA